ncbi:hypothetical protein Lalb_Chr01g0013721 [Lupinus albus]|uniref:Uncharacterized protein n=1 Tax=Lupinus albus TaxID=3870 RepID=A0A6A4R632_LUPAL|nr:hypothetical protein Lalb_Chr01g0013721 [Lupinus albus]
MSSKHFSLVLSHIQTYILSLPPLSQLNFLSHPLSSLSPPFSTKPSLPPPFFSPTPSHNHTHSLMPTIFSPLFTFIIEILSLFTHIFFSFTSFLSPLYKQTKRKI